MTRELPAWLAKSPLLARAYGLGSPPIVREVIELPVEQIRERVTPTRVLSYSKRRRARLKRAKRCINGWGHGKATHGCRCKRCHDVHRGKRKKR